MRILFTNNTLNLRGGTELYVLDIARRLQALGHMPMAYSTQLGVVSEAIREAGIPVVDNLAHLPFQPDIIHGHHHLDTMTALLCFPGVPALYFCHGAIPWQEMAPVFPRIHRYVAVDQACFERLICEHAIPEEKITMLLNFVDLQRFQPRSSLPARPRRALLYSVSHPGIEPIIRQACVASGIELDMAGTSIENSTSEPEKLLPQYDLVFAKGRAAMEALAVGCSVITLSGMGCGPLVTTKNFDHLRRLNFGYRTAQNTISLESIATQLALFDASDAAAVTRRIRSEADMCQTVDSILQLYSEVMAEHRQTPPDPAAESRAAGIYLQSILPLLKHALKGPRVSKRRYKEKLARKTDRLAAWLRRS